MSTRTSPAARFVGLIGLIGLVCLVCLVGALLLRDPAADPDAAGEAGAAVLRPAARLDEHAPEKGLALARTPPIRGIIRAAAGPAISGALVCSAPWTPPQSRSRWRWTPTLAGLLATVCRRSDDAGRFSLASGRGRFSVRASAPGHITASHEVPVLVAPAQAPPEIELTLEAGGRTVRGRVVDRFGGPIDGVLIASDDGGFAIADDEGRFELVAVASPAILVPWSPGYVSRAVLTPAPASDVVVTMTPEAVVEGRVVDATGDPVADIDVRTGRRDSEELTTTDVRGHFRLSGLLPGVVPSPDTPGTGEMIEIPADGRPATIVLRVAARPRPHPRGRSPVTFAIPRAPLRAARSGSAAPTARCSQPPRSTAPASSPSPALRPGRSRWSFAGPGRRPGWTAGRDSISSSRRGRHGRSSRSSPAVGDRQMCPDHPFAMRPASTIRRVSAARELIPRRT